ncbi:hypothetical protein GCM10023196_069590 [Actinoallomurus vinaceus]|uniref:Spore-associated protein A n=1 Tax=Actinoallomurus vinaceus TaxID=1080074 RepID=A0ABP8UND1_9ACTN
MNGMKRLAVVALGGGMALAASVGTAAAAGTQPFTPEQVCATVGTGFQVVESQPLGTAGEARVYWLNNGTSNCVVTLKQGSYVGNSVKVSASLTTGATTKVDGPSAFKYYAGPVTQANPSGECVVYGGTYGSYKFTSQPACG